MNKALQTAFITLVLAVIAATAVSLFTDIDQVFIAIAKLSWQIWALILMLSLVNYLLRYWRWHLYIAHQHHCCSQPGQAYSHHSDQGQSLVENQNQNQNPTLNHYQHLLIYIAGFALTMTPGKAGEAMRSLYLKQHGISHQRSISALLVERIMDLLTILVLAALGFLFLPGAQAQLAAVVTVVIITVCIVAVKLPKAWVLNRSWFKKMPLKLQQAFAFIAQTLDNANDLLSPKFFLMGMAIGLLAWFCEAYGLYLVMQAFDIEKSTLFLALAIYGVGILIGAISFLPGGLGGTEASMIFLLLKLGFVQPAAVAITLICRLATLWFAVLLGVIAMLVMLMMGLKPQFKES